MKLIIIFSILVIGFFNGHSMVHAQFQPTLALASLDGLNGFVMYGTNAQDRLGGSVSDAGDVNADGVDDLIIGAHYSCFVVFGGTKNFPNPLLPSALNGQNGFKIIGINQFRISGEAVGNSGDVNGDGIDDLIIGSDGSSINGTDSGAGFIVFGSAEGFSNPLDLAALDGDSGFMIIGWGVGDRAGYSVSRAGDFNADGIDDFAIGTHSGDGTGRVYIIFGSNIGFPNPLFLYNLDGLNGLVFIDPDGGLGKSVSPAGDINGDGIDDFIIGGSKKGYIVFGSNQRLSNPFYLSDLNGSNGFVISGLSSYTDDYGHSVAGAGDINDDGFDDLIIGDRLSDINGHFSGASYLVYGSDQVFSIPFDVSTLNGINGAVFLGADGGDEAGRSVNAVGDINDDGVDDIIIGAWAAPGGGTSNVIFGKKQGIGSPIRLSSLNGTNGFVIQGVDEGDQSGLSTSYAGDINADGVHDLIIGAYRVTSHGLYSGASYVVFGRGNGIFRNGFE